MAKGSVRKKGKKWYYRFYVEDASGNQVQKEFTGTESKSETEKLLRQAMEDYEEKKFIAKAENTTLGDLLDVWAEESLKTGSLSNGTVENYIQTIKRIKKHPISKRKLKTITSDHLQKFMDLLVFGGSNFKLANIFALAEEIRHILDKDVDVFEINEINVGSEFYDRVMEEKVLVA